MSDGDPFEPSIRGVQVDARPPGWQETYARRLVAVDLLAVVLAVALAQWLRFGGPLAIARPRGGSSDWVVYFSNYLVVSTLIIVGWMLVLSINRSRAPRVIGSGVEEYRRVCVSTAATFGSIAIISMAFKLEIARGYLLIALPSGILLLILFRWIARRVVVEARKRYGHCVTRILVVGNPSAVRDLASSFAGNGSEFAVVGACVSGRASRRPLDIAGVGIIPNFGDESNIVAAATETNSFAVAVAASEQLDGRALRELSWELEGLNIDMFVAPGVVDVAGPRLQMRPIAGLPLIHVEKPTYQGAKQFEKRLFDVVFSSLVLLCGLPILALIGLAIKLTSPGPVFYRQERIGVEGRPFQIIKFRTMVDRADTMLGGLVSLNESPGGVLFKMRDDPRVTPVGRVLRKYSLDELPQFINVLKRDMSVVGPRPPLASEVETYDDSTRRRLLVRPGITGLWQVSGRSDLSWSDSVRLDLFYVENWSMVSDLLIAVKTVKVILSHAGAY
ncbi:sugar transferase [Mycolicibacterium sarraceniae]|uniref:Polyprenyl glycosylphosphotransferase n=1 Tax=Mycolicibacterium sarraceniae TaxID=1534348 RepID=A0A7I7SRH1_9MYCO|nr:sugar transferase [Mycolicibacterium sarraceniae]BBY59323.1 polyprenyl glycosylphosphotransferase [Mycolicibacterium sarraceniae]